MGVGDEAGGGGGGRGGGGGEIFNIFGKVGEPYWVDLAFYWGT